MSDVNSDSNPRPNKTSAESNLGMFKFVTSIVASLTLILVLLGFGVSLAVESKLALPHSSLYESSIELLDLGSVAVVSILPKLFSQFGELATYLRMIADVWKTLWVFLAIYAVGVPLVFYLKYVKKIDFKLKKDQIKGRLAASDAKGFWVKACLVFALLLASSLLPIVVYFGLVVSLALVSMVPMIGWVAGLAYIDQVAIHDHACSPLPSLQYYEAQKSVQNAKKPDARTTQPDTVQCVQILKDDNVLASGRLVLSTSKAVVLYLPDGIARRVPIGDSVIEVIDKLPVKDTQASPPANPQGGAPHTGK